MINFFSIGAYGSSEDIFFSKLSNNKIDTFIDIRQRRGVRGSKYAFVNSKRLQFKLSEMNIVYKHIIELAPTKDIRELQKQFDKQNNVLKRDRQELGVIFKKEYQKGILDIFNFDEFLEILQHAGHKNIVLFCVEERANACHRSMVTDQLAKMNFKIQHL